MHPWLTSTTTSWVSLPTISTRRAGRAFSHSSMSGQSKVEERTFSLNLVDVTVSFVDGWAEIADLFAADRIHRLTLAQLRAIAASIRKRGT